MDYLKSKFRNPFKARHEVFHRPAGAQDRWLTAELTKLLSEQDTAPDIGYRIARMKKYMRTLRNVFDFERVAKPRTEDPPADIFAGGYTAYVGDIIEAGKFQCYADWQEDTTNCINKSPELRLIQGGKSKESKITHKENISHGTIGCYGELEPTGVAGSKEEGDRE